jgi:endonuclease/exonuclease/phosphatase (EEP) superfamily protein YafD
MVRYRAMPDPGATREDRAGAGGGAAGPSGANLRRWAGRGVACVLWAGVVAAGVQVVVAWAWEDDLRPVSRGVLFLHYLAFMARAFMFHAGVAALVAAALGLALRRWRLAAAGLVVGLAGVGPELTFPRSATAMAADQRGETIKILSANLSWTLQDFDPVLSLITRERPDIVLFQEWTPGAGSLRRALAPVYPHSVEFLRNDGFGQAVFSKRAFLEQPRLAPPVGRWTEPQIWFDVEFDGRPVRIANIHLLPPIWWGAFGTLRAGAGTLAEWAKFPDGERPDVLMGDFNSVRRSCTLRGLVRAGYVEAHAAAGAGRGSTWPRKGVFRLVPGVRIDHAFVAPGLRVVDARVGDDFGSDHAPVIVEIARDP